MIIDPEDSEPETVQTENFDSKQVEFDLAEQKRKQSAQRSRNQSRKRLNEYPILQNLRPRRNIPKPTQAELRDLELRNFTENTRKVLETENERFKSLFASENTSKSVQPNSSNIHDLKHLGDTGKSTKFALKLTNIPATLDWRSVKETCLQYGAVTFVMKTSKTEGIVTFATRRDMKNAKTGLGDRSVFGNRLHAEYFDKNLAIIVQNPKKTETVKRVHDSEGKYCHDLIIKRDSSPVPRDLKVDRSGYDWLINKCKRLSQINQSKFRLQVFKQSVRLSHSELLDYFVGEVKSLEQKDFNSSNALKSQGVHSNQSTNTMMSMMTKTPAFTPFDSEPFRTMEWVSDPTQSYRYFFQYGTFCYSSREVFKSEKEAKNSTAKLVLSDIGVLKGSFDRADLTVFKDGKIHGECTDIEFESSKPLHILGTDYHSQDDDTEMMPWQEEYNDEEWMVH
jgi:hypothetical protein